MRMLIISPIPRRRIPGEEAKDMSFVFSLHITDMFY
jgi:hypothetical protein